MNVGLPNRVRRRRVVAAPGLERYEDLASRCGFRDIAGVDEAGRGAAAGPLVVAAVILSPGASIRGLRDSKLLTPKAREGLRERIVAEAKAVAIVVVTVAEIDHVGVHVADVVGMRRAVARLPVHADFAITDGFGPAGLPMSALAVWKGDRVCASVAAAGIVAKVTRDQLMVEYDRPYPQYGFGVHKGYLTAQHAGRLDALGPCAIHRRSFAPVRRALLENAGSAPQSGQSDARPLAMTVLGESSGAVGAAAPPKLEDVAQ